MHTRVAGIPCQVFLTHYSPPINGRINAEVDYCYPPEPEEIEYEICDRRGRTAPWLAKKVTPAIDAQICAQLRSH